MTLPSRIYRTENISIGYDPAGTAATLNQKWGILTGEIELAEPEFDWQPFFGVPSTSRNRITAHKGKQLFRGRIPNIWLVHDDTSSQYGPFRYMIGAPTAVGPPLIYNDTAIQTLPDFDMAIKFVATDATAFTRNYLNCKINRWTLSANQGEQLRLSIDEWLCKDMRHDLDAAIPKYAANGILSTSTRNPGTATADYLTQPYVFSGGSMKFFGTEFSRLTAFSMVCNQNLTAQYYVTTAAAGDQRQIPYEITEGKRDYKISATVFLDNTIADAKFLKELLLQGNENGTDFTGFDLDFTFTKLGSSPAQTVRLQLPAAAASTSNVGCLITRAPHNVPAPPEALIPITVEIDAPSLLVTIAN